MMTPLGDMDEGVVADHLCEHDSNRCEDSNCMQYPTFNKPAVNWINMIAPHNAAVDEASPQTNSHLSRELNNISDLTSFDFGQRLPSLESTSNTSIGKCPSSLSSHSVFAWQPFGHNQQHSSSFHAPGGHLFPLVPGSTDSAYGGIGHGSSPTVSSLPSTPADLMDCHLKPDPLFNYSVAYPNSGTPNSNKQGSSVVPSPVSQSGCCPPDLQALRLSMLLPNPHSPSTPVPIYPQTATSTGSASNSVQSNQQAFCSPTGSVNSNPFQDVAKNQKQRSKKESHNRIERKRRDYINSQIVYLSSLLPPELYRDVDGRRNKGSVLRLSVNYIMELREAVSRMANLKQENTLARQLIPLLLQRIETLEKTALERGHDLKTVATSRSTSTSGSQSLETVYQSWLRLNEANQRSCNGNSRPSSSGQFSHTIQSSDPRYLPGLVLRTDSVADLDLNTGKPQHHLTSVKKEQSEEDRSDGGGSMCIRTENRRLGSGGYGSTSEPIEEEVASQDGSFESQPNSAYEYYATHMMSQASQSSVFQPNH